MAIEFFNFVNQETFHFFQWICKSVPSGPEALIADAFKRADEPGEMEFPGEDVCYAVRDRLAEILEKILDDVASTLDIDDELLEIGTVWTDEQGRPVGKALWQPILALAFGQIDCRTVAEALLIRHGKWNPSQEPPEII